MTTSSADVWLGDDGILRTCVDPDLRQTMATAREIAAAYDHLSPDRRRPILIDMRQHRAGIDRDARLFYASSEAAKRLTAAAVLVQSAPSRIIANFFVSVTRPPIPLRLFGQEQEALAWLAQYHE